MVLEQPGGSSRSVSSPAAVDNGSLITVVLFAATRSHDPAGAVTDVQN